MNEDQENRELRRMLEEAMPIDRARTSATPPAAIDPETVDPETAALRQAWQRFGALLETGAPGERAIESDPVLGSLLASAEPIQTRDIEVGSVEIRSVEIRSAEIRSAEIRSAEIRSAEIRSVEIRSEAFAGRQGSPNRRRFRGSAIALAASLLLAVGLVVTLKIIEGLTNRRAAPPTNSIANGEGKTQSNQTVRSDRPSQTSDQNSNLVAADARASGLQWNDSVDEDITAVARATALANQDWYSKSVGIGAVETGVNDLSRELDQGSL